MARTEIICPFVIVRDTREQMPYQFTGIRADAAQRRLPVIVHTIDAGLESGDYSIQGCEHRLSIERKSLPDAWTTFTVDHARFVRELERLNQMDWAGIVVEGDPVSFSRGPIERSGADQAAKIGKACARAWMKWSQRFPRVHWFFWAGRALAELATFRLLECWWIDNVKDQQGGQGGGDGQTQKELFGADVVQSRGTDSAAANDTRTSEGSGQAARSGTYPGSNRRRSVTSRDEDTAAIWTPGDEEEIDTDI